ncbi:hypothetical protein [Aquimarina algicola]|uniref:Uncharacterized protein n=1 Tax=Aquimarina algicola TaxID=2589995 RepID=A0A504JE09_9FLAO|nr:hypothetical protein [Aquimarina algicola]TPN85099.1 hypothetical protein FHK87_13795 [Aquimarina algicola]
MESIKELSLSKKVANQPFITAGIIAAIGIILFILTGRITFFGIGALLVIIGILNQNLKVVKIFPKYIEVKLGVIASKKFIRYDQITQFNATKKTLEIQYNTEQNKSKKVKIAVRALENEDILALDNILQENTDLGVSNSLIQKIVN